MYLDDLALLCCPETFEPLELVNGVVADADGEIVEGQLRSNTTGKLYPIRNGIPRFVEQAITIAVGTTNGKSLMQEKDSTTKY